MSRALITGSTGFVGRNLIPYLEKLKINAETLSRVEVNSGLGKLNKGDSVIHLAGKAHDLKKVVDPKEYYDVNFELTKKIYSEFLKSEASLFIFISSVKAVADQVIGVLKEDQVPEPHTHYGKSKLMAEQFIINQPLPEGKSYFILRPCMIHGPGNKGNLNLLYKVVKTGIPYPLAGFMNKRSFLSVENLCFVISEFILRNDIPYGVYQISDNESLSTNEVVEILSESLNKKPRLWRLSPSIIRFLSKIGDKLNLPLTTERLNKLTESYVVSNEKLMKVLKKNMPLSTKDGLKLTAISFSLSDK